LKIKYSFIVPFYNVEKYLAECLDSLVQFPRDDYEILLINDGSRDGSREIALDYMERYKQIRLVEQENRGLGGARNTGLANAKGEWILFVDSDDYVDKTLLTEADRQTGMMQEDDIAVFNFAYLYPNGRIVPELSFAQTIPMEQLQRAKFYSVPVTCCGKIFHRNFFAKNEIVLPEKRYYEDVAVSLKVMLGAKNLYFTDAPLYIYRQRDTSITKNRDHKKMYDMVRNIEEQYRYFVTRGTYEQYKEEVEYFAILHTLLEIVPRMIEDDPKSVYVRKMCAYMKRRFPDYEKNPYLDKLSRRNRLYLKLIGERKYTALQMIIRGKTGLRNVLEKLGLFGLIQNYKEKAVNRL